MPDGATLRDHLQAAARALKRKPPELEVTPIPCGCSSLIRAFFDIRAGCKPDGMAGMTFVCLSDVLAYESAYGVKFTPWEIGTFSAMNQAAIEAAHG